jgi:WD40 repeat protein
MEDDSGNPVAGNWSVTFSPDGRSLAAPSNGSLYVWNTADGSIVAHPKVPNVGSLAFTPDGRWLLAAEGDQLGLWNTRTWTADETADASGVSDVAVSPIGTAAATLSWDGRLTLWRMNPLRQRLVIASDLDGYKGPHTLAFSPDGTRLAVAVGNTVSVFALGIDDLMDLARNRLTRGFTGAECRQYLHLDRCPIA